jgi:hypothetical protein
MATASSSQPAAKITTRGLSTAIVWGAVAGLIGSIIMAMYAMLAAATYQHSGFFTPMYHIASLVIAPDTMMTSMHSAMAGHTFTFAFGPALLGAIIHMMVGAIYGAMFGVLVRLARVSKSMTLVAGLAWGVIVFAFSCWVGLPIAAAVFDAGAPIRNMATIVGYPTFLVEHLIYGATLGLVLMSARLAKR